MGFADKLKELRKEKKLTQNDLAKKIGVSARTIQFYEAGKTYPRSHETVILICTEFGVTPDELFSKNENEFRPSLLYFDYSKGDKLDFLKIIHGIEDMYKNEELNDEDKRALIQLIQLKCAELLHKK